MTTHDGAFAPGTPCWIDLCSSDTSAAKSFYGTLLGWTFTDSGPEYGGYVSFSSGGRVVAGMMGNSAETGIPDAWTTYFATADVDATVRAATGAGAQVRVEPMDVPEMGRMAVLGDPAGGVFGLWQAGGHTGFGRVAEPGAPSWHEHHSTAFDKSTPFYAEVFGWELDKMADTDDFRYYTGAVRGEAVVGLMDDRSAPASHWAVYLHVPDADAALAQVPGLGGTVLRAAEDTPHGRLADVADPTGAAFKLHGPNNG